MSTIEVRRKTDNTLVSTHAVAPDGTILPPIQGADDHCILWTGLRIEGAPGVIYDRLLKSRGNGGWFGVQGDDSEPDEGTRPRPSSDIAAWWAETDQADFDAFGPKLQEYGANDLREIGRALATLMGWEDPPDRVLSELGCWFYLKVKMERAFEALKRHELPSDDTAHDITVYSKMIRRIRYRGELS